jgi:hypothetical protein
MKQATVYVAGLLGSVLLVAGQAEAHHSSAMFDMTKPVVVEGTIKEFQFTNPHTWLLIDVTGKDGKVVTWGFENENPGQLLREGIRKTDFPAGAHVKVTADPLKTGEPGGHWTQIQFVDTGKVIDRSRGPGLPPTTGPDSPNK